MTTEKRLVELERQVSEHLAGRKVKIVWDRQGPAANSVGQVTKSISNELIIYIAPMNAVNSRYKVWLHELSHIANGDHKFVARGNAHLPAGSQMPTPQARADWRQNPRELAAQAQADVWEAYADRYMHKHWRAGRTKMECRLMALLEMDTKKVARPKGAIK